jgi:hypothetical protein
MLPNPIAALLMELMQDVRPATLDFKTPFKAAKKFQESLMGVFVLLMHGAAMPRHATFLMLEVCQRVNLDEIDQV